MKYFAIIVVLLAVGIGAGFYISNSKDSAPAADTSSQNQNQDTGNPTSTTPANSQREDSADSVQTTPKETVDEVDKNVGEEMMTPEVKTFAVSGTNFSFSPKEIRVKKGDKVVINFASLAGFHDVTVEGYNKATAQINTGGNASVEFVADQAGTFIYYCSVGNHRAQGMEGKLIVE